MKARIPPEAMKLATLSNSASNVSSYVSIFETLWKQSGMYEESQNQLHTAEDELDRMKQYLNEALKEVASFKMTIRSTSPQQVGSMVSDSHQIIHD